LGALAAAGSDRADDAEFCDDANKDVDRAMTRELSEFFVRDVAARDRPPPSRSRTRGRVSKNTSPPAVGGALERGNSRVLASSLRH
jgi:hypothetical protein